MSDSELFSPEGLVIFKWLFGTTLEEREYLLAHGMIEAECGWISPHDNPSNPPVYTMAEMVEGMKQLDAVLLRTGNGLRFNPINSIARLYDWLKAHPGMEAPE